MNSLINVNLLACQGAKIESNLLLKDLINANPSFKGYYLNYLLNFKCLPDSLGELLCKNLDEDEINYIQNLERKYEELIQNKWNGKKISFCIAVKNRSVVNVQWNGVTKNKTFVPSYKNKPVNFQLSLLKNFVASIVDACPKGIGVEIVIVDFNSTDDPPENWIYKIEKADNKNIDIVLVKSEESFSRGRGLNIASEKATGDVVFFTDADMLISKEFIIQCFEIAFDNQKPFFPICYSYYTPFHQEGWIRSEGWGNLVIPRSYLSKISWWEKNSWGSEDNHMKEQLEGEFVREQGVCLYHQWHPEGDFKTKYYTSEKNKFDVVIAVTTYNRLDYLKAFIKSWMETRNAYYNWHFIINDDGSDDGTLKYLESLKLEGVKLYIIRNNRKGVHEGTNAIFDRIQSIKPDYIFKCDDDVVFKQKGWDNLYIKGLDKFSFMCNYQTMWRDSKPLARQEGFVAHSNAYYSQGAFIAMTYSALNKIGWMDTKTFGYKGYGHIDLAVRACRAGLNNFDKFYDVEGSSNYITYQFDDYQPAMTLEEMKTEFKLDANESHKELMKDLILNKRKHVVYVARSSIYEYPKCTARPRVHMIIHNNHIGGAEYVHYNHMQILKELGCDITVWSIGTGYTFDKMQKIGVKIIHQPGLLTADEEWSIFNRAVKDGDYVYNCNAYSDDKFKELSTQKHIYYCTIVHSNVDWIVKHQAQYRYFTYRYIVINPYIKQSLAEAGINPNKILYVPNGLNKDFDYDWSESNSKSLRQEHKIPINAIVVGYVGRIGKDKNSKQLVELANRICSVRDNVYFLVVGGKSERAVDLEYFNEFTKSINNINDPLRFIYVGEKTDNELIKYYDLMDVAVNISPSEGLPITLLEQLGRGLYCIYPGFQAIKDLLENFYSKALPIMQRKGSQNLEYSESELNLYSDFFKEINKGDLLKHRSENIKRAKNLFSYEVSKEFLTRLLEN